MEILTGYPVNHLIEYAAAKDIRPVMVRQERIGLHMADAISRVTSGGKIGAFCMQHGPGSENAYGGVAQAYGESVPILVVPMGYPRRLAHIDPNFNSTTQMRGISKSAEPVMLAAEVPHIMRRAFTRLRNGRGGPVLVEVPSDMWTEELPGELDYEPVLTARYGPDPADVKRAAELLANAKRPVIYAGTGIHWARAWPQLRRLAELLAAPVTTSLGGKSSFPETHPLSLGSGGLAIPKPVRHFLDNADLVFGIGCSFTETNFGLKMPRGPRYIHSTLDPIHLNKDVRAEVGLVGDAGLTLDALLTELEGLVRSPRDPSKVAAEIQGQYEPWLAEWMPKLASKDAPLNPYRVLWDLQHTVDLDNTIITHDAGSPRDQLSPFWRSTTPLSYLGWGKTTQLGYGLGLAMGAKLAAPEKLCINVWGDAAIGFTGMDFETAVRERIPILSILLNNFSMAIELKVMPISTEKYRSTDISGDYAAMARAFGGPWRAGDGARGDRARHPARHREDAAGRAGAPGIHHLEGDLGFEALRRETRQPRRWNGRTDGHGRYPRRAEGVRFFRGAARGQRGHRRWAVRGAGRAIRLRQVHPAQDAGRTREHHQRRDRHRRPGGEHLAAEGPGHRHGVPELRALSAHDGGARTWAFSHQARASASKGGRRRKSVSAVRREILGLESQFLDRYPAPAFRRSAPACRHGPGHRAQSASLPVRRAALQPRRQATGPDASRDQAALQQRSQQSPRSTSRTTRSRP